MKAMILAAGFGTRLRPLTYSIPKPMVPVCNRPLIGYAVEAFIRQGVKEIVVNLHHLPKAIEKYLQAEYGDQVKFHFSFEQEILGTGGGVRKVRSILETDEEFFLVNGDTIQSPPYDELLRARRSRNALAALTLRHPPEGDRFTAVYFENGVITGFGNGTGEPLMFSGSHIISSRIFRLLPDKEFSGIVDEVYQPAIAKKSDVITGVIDDGPWFDIGTPHRYISAAEGVLDLTLSGKLPVVQGSKIAGDSIVHSTATVMGKATRSSIGKRSTVKGDIRNSVISPHCQITRHAVIESCILGEGVEINQPIELHNSIVCRDDDAIPRDPSYRYENGLVVAPF